MTDAKHEAPAEGAGEMDDDDASTYTPSVAGLSDYLWNQAQAADSVEGRCILEMWREAVDALRARSSAPEAREGEAVAWMMRENSGFPWAFTNDAEDARLAKADGFEARPLYTLYAAPSADKLRIAVEAIDRAVVVRAFCASDPLSYRLEFANADDRFAAAEAIDQALAALKAEGAK